MTDERLMIAEAVRRARLDEMRWWLLLWDTPEFTEFTGLLITERMNSIEKMSPEELLKGVAP